MELLCIETASEPIASFDSSIIDDDRTLHNLILTEERYLIAGSYFKCLQTELKPSMRDIVANWMLEVLSHLLTHSPSLLTYSFTLSLSLSQCTCVHVHVHVCVCVHEQNEILLINWHIFLIALS